MRCFLLAEPRAYLRYIDLPGSGARREDVRSAPAGVPLLFLHGLGCASSAEYPRVAADPQLADRRSLLVDLLGFGFSDRPEGYGYAIGDHARAVCAFVRGLQLPAIDLFGHSMGGAVAIEAARELGDTVRRLVLSEPNLDCGGGSFSRPVAERSEEDFVARGRAATVRSALSDGQEVWAGTVQVASAVAIHRGARSLVQGATPPWRDQLAALHVPRTVLFGARSLPDADTERLHEVGVTVQVVPDAGHSMAVENPSGLAAAIRRAVS